MVKQQSFWVYLSISFAVLFWSLSFIWYKQAYVYFGPVSVILMRLILSSVFLFPLAKLIKKLPKLRKHDLKYFLLLSFFQPFLYFLGESIGVKLISSTLASVIVTTIPLFTPFIASRFFDEKISLLNYMGIILSVIGVTLVVFYKGFDQQVEVSLTGLFMMALAVAAALGYSVVVKKMTTRYNSVAIVTYQNFIGIFYFLPIFFIFEYRHFVQVSFNLQVLWPIIELSVFASSFAFIFFTYAIKYIGITRANIFANLIPLLTAVFAYFMLGEAFTVYKVLGIFIVMGGLFLSQIQRRKQIMVINEPVAGATPEKSS